MEHSLPGFPMYGGGFSPMRPHVPLDVYRLEGSREEKAAFAHALLRTPDEPMRAAIEVFGRTHGAKCYAASVQWIDDATVRECMAELVAKHGAEAFLPTRADIAREVHDTAKHSFDTETRLKGLKLYAEIMGFVTKAGNVVNVNNTTQNNVMVVRDRGSTKQWEADLEGQQAKLIADATADG